MTENKTKGKHKLKELSIPYGAEVEFLLHSDINKPYTFGIPSFGVLAKRFLNMDLWIINGGEGSSSTFSFVNEHNKLTIDELCRAYNNVVEEAGAEEVRRKIMKAAYAPYLPVGRDEWWKVVSKDEEEDVELLMKTERFYEKLCEIVAAKKN